ncbi:MAG: M2 family metallopeptidase [Gammaproteobacteria bacterium]|nr:M2 family metallopeptidase [Gammaproteobacteria bacterium]
MRHCAKLLAAILLTLLLPACSQQASEQAIAEPPRRAAAGESAEAFVARISTEFEGWWKELNAANWLRETYINEDSAMVQALANERYAAWHSKMVKEALYYDGLAMSPATRRALDLFKRSALIVAPDDAAKRKEQARIQTELAGLYGAGSYCRSPGDCLVLGELEQIMAQSRDYDELLDAWRGWRSVSPPMRDKYARFVELANEGANEFGYEDLGDMWRSAYDMSSADFAAEAERLWQQVQPLYDALHCHVRAKLGEYYGADQVPQDGPIPAHLLGNMWAQDWTYVYELLEPYRGVAEFDVEKTLRSEDYTPRKMVRSAESFYVSLGLPRLPDTFWERSLFARPVDRDVVCHAGAWNMDAAQDLRIKMCIEPTYDKLRTIYHELGHNYYYWAYNKQPILFRDGAHSGFHEAIGDTVLLSMTPEYLAEVGLIAAVPESEQATINRQMQLALDRIAFLPFSKLIDAWRWKVFSGEILPADYNSSWWELRTRYQGIAAPLERSEADFDPGAKFHVPANRSYTGYFLAHILMFQIHRALCASAGFEGELHQCSIYGSKDAGERLWAMLAAGASRPWQDTLEKLTGTREMDASGIIDYFAPLLEYLEVQNADRSCGW